VGTRLTVPRVLEKPLLPPRLPDVVMAEPGTATTTEFTGLKPPTKPPVPEEVVVPPNERLPTPSVVVAPPSCLPVAPPLDLPVAEPNTVLTLPELPLLVLKFPSPPPEVVPVAVPDAVPEPLATPELVEVPKALPPANWGLKTGNPNCNFLDPLRLEDA
jgi:hypothetical protein